MCLKYMSLVMRKPAFCICENKHADQLRSNPKADQHLCVRYTDITIPLLPKSEIKPLAIFCGCTARFVSDLVGNPEDPFSHNKAHIFSILQLWCCSMGATDRGNSVQGYRCSGSGIWCSSQQTNLTYSFHMSSTLL